MMASLWLQRIFCHNVDPCQLSWATKILCYTLLELLLAVKHVVAYGGFVSKTTLPFICMLNYYANSVSKLLKLTTPPFWSIFRTLPPIFSEHLSFKVSRILKKSWIFILNSNQKIWLWASSQQATNHVSCKHPTVSIFIIEHRISPHKWMVFTGLVISWDERISRGRWTVPYKD